MSGTRSQSGTGLGLAIARLLADHLGISFASVARIWREWKLQPWRRETFKFSTDPQLEAKVRDVVGLYLNPPTNAIVLCAFNATWKVNPEVLDVWARILAATPGAFGAPSCLTPTTGLSGWWPGDGNANDIAGANNGALQGGGTADMVGMAVRQHNMPYVGRRLANFADRIENFCGAAGKFG